MDVTTSLSQRTPDRLNKTYTSNPLPFSTLYHREIPNMHFKLVFLTLMAGLAITATANPDANFDDVDTVEGGLGARSVPGGINPINGLPVPPPPEAPGINPINGLPVPKAPKSNHHEKHKHKHHHHHHVRR